ncbi:tail fiber protein [Aeromonas media]|uniref:tail fiber protein n=1 Tax=Aeromonas media TaxID=651 RepID=UPI00111A069C|nr:tail fiber protein [Aeromonas media]TNI70204.1 hypothetical protein CF122_13465 [Aeromonas media]
MGYKVIVNERPDLPGFETTTKVVVVENTNIGFSQYTGVMQASQQTQDNADEVRNSLVAVTTHAVNAKSSELNAKVSEDNSRTSELNAKASELNAKTYEDNSRTSELNSKSSELNSKSSEVNSKDSELKSKDSELNAVNAANHAQATLANAIIKSNPVSDVEQGSAANSLTRRDFVEDQGKGKKTLTIPLPAGAPTTGYLPVIFTQGDRASRDVFIGTYSSGGDATMNNCTFDGKVYSGGWSDSPSYVSGVFTLYQTEERAIHSIQGSTQNNVFYCIYVEARAFPIIVRVDVDVTVEATTGAIIDSTTFRLNGHESGNINTRILANFNSGSGVYENGDKVYNTSYNPTPAAVGAVAKTGDEMSGNLQFSNPGHGILLQDYPTVGGGNGLFVGNGDGASSTLTNIQLKSWFGIGFASTTENPDNENSIWFDTRSGNIATVGGISTGNTIYIEPQNGTSSLILNANAAGESQFTFAKSGKLRWMLGMDVIPETGANNGSDLTLHAYGDDGSYGAPVFKVYRNTKQLEFFTQPFSAAPQNNAGHALTRRDWVEGELSSKVSKTGDTMSGALTSTGPTGNWRIALPGETNYGSFWHQDNNDLYLMLTDPGNQTGSFNSLRPLSVSLSTGLVVMRNGLVVEKSGDSIIINNSSNQAGYLRGQINGVDNWYMGRGSASSHDLYMYSQAHGTYLQLQADRILFNKPITTGAAQSSLPEALTRKDYVDAEISKLIARIAALEAKQ